MKKLLPLFLLPSLVWAQPPEGQQSPPEGQMPAPPSFDQFKQTMQPIIDKTLPAMRETRECVSKAESKEDVEKCMNQMAEKAQGIQKETGQESKAVAQKAPEGFEWTPETKKAMLQKMDHSIIRNNAMNECLKTSNTREEMDACMNKRIPRKKVQ